jgi:ankyrin repeat protein
MFTIKPILNVKARTLKVMSHGYQHQSTLHDCNLGVLKEVVFLVDSGADISAVNRFGSTPLHYACIYGNLEVVKFLIDNGADISAVDMYGDTPLHESCSYANLEIVKLLIDSGVDISTTDNLGDTPLELLNDNQREEMEVYVETINFGVKPAKR